jgi:hypothetical protein
MCTGLEWLAIAGSLGGTGLSMAGQQQAASAMRSKQAAEAARQAEYSKQAQQQLAESIAKTRPEERAKQKEEGTQKALSEYAKVQAIPLSVSSAASDAGPIKANIVDPVSAARQSMSNAAAAPMQGWDEATLQQWLKDMQAKSALGQISSRAQASANVLPIEMQAAQHAGDALSGIGSLLSTGSGLLGLYGATQAPAAAAARAAGQRAAQSAAKQAITRGLFGAVSPMLSPVGDVYNYGVSGYNYLKPFLKPYLP